MHGPLKKNLSYAQLLDLKPLLRTVAYVYNYMLIILLMMLLMILHIIFLKNVLELQLLTYFLVHKYCTVVNIS